MRRLQPVRLILNFFPLHFSDDKFKGIKRTKLRLFRCRKRMNMDQWDRINDARADQNLADVPRIPAPWDTKPSIPLEIAPSQDVRVR